MIDAAIRSDAPLDLAFLELQTLGDPALAREVLALFVEQARRLVPHLPRLAPPEQTATAHLLKGSCQGIGATHAADLLQRYDVADEPTRRRLQPELETTFATLEEAIAAHLAAP